jgi:hypothetical protein
MKMLESIEGLYFTLSTRVSVPSSELATPPHPLSRKRVCPPPPEPKGEQHSLAVEGAGEPIRTIGEKAWHSVRSMLVMVFNRIRSRKFLQLYMLLLKRVKFILTARRIMSTSTQRPNVEGKLCQDHECFMGLE